MLFVNALLYVVLCVVLFLKYKLLQYLQVANIGFTNDFTDKKFKGFLFKVTNTTEIFE